MKQSLIEKIAVTWEMCGGRALTEAAQEMIVKSLEKYDPDQVDKALDRCFEECRGIAYSDIVARIDDGWPSPDEAWALCPRSEYDTTVWFDECAGAYGDVANLERDKVAQRMAFKEAYKRRIVESKSQGKRPKWWPSVGIDVNHQDLESIILEAVRKGRLTAEYAKKTFGILPVIKMVPEITGSVDEIVNDLADTMDAAKAANKKAMKLLEGGKK